MMVTPPPDWFGSSETGTTQTPTFSATTNQLDLFRIVVFALGVFIGYSLKK